MNAIITQMHEQPEFAENLAKAVQEEISRKYVEPIYKKLLQITRPDYTQPIGLRNLFRTTYRVEFEKGTVGAANGMNNRFVHVSNVLYGDNRDTIAVVYEYKPVLDKDGNVVTPGKTVTRHYTDPASMPSVPVTYHSNDELVGHITGFMTDSSVRF